MVGTSFDGQFGHDAVPPQPTRSAAALGRTRHVAIEAAKQYGEVAAQSFSRPGWLFSPRLPGHEEYMAAFDDAVRRAVAGSASPAAALAEAAAHWQKITDRLGRAEQQQAYCRSLGLEP